MPRLRQNSSSPPRSGKTSKTMTSGDDWDLVALDLETGKRPRAVFNVDGPLVATNPPLRIMMIGQQRRVKKRSNTTGNRLRRKQPANNGIASLVTTIANSTGEHSWGILAVLLVLAFVVAVEMFTVDRLFLGPYGRLANMEELHDNVSTAKVYVADIVEAGWDRYHPRHSQYPAYGDDGGGDGGSGGEAAHFAARSPNIWKNSPTST